MRARNLLVGQAGAIALVVALGLAGCAEKADPEAESTPTPTAGTGASESPSDTGTERAGQVVPIVIEGGRVTPNGETVEVDADEPVVLRITADEPGELHVHTSPEQEVSYEAGTSRHELALGRPGVYEVESHDLRVVIVKLQAS